MFVSLDWGWKNSGCIYIGKTKMVQIHFYIQSRKVNLNRRSKSKAILVYYLPINGYIGTNTMSIEDIFNLFVDLELESQLDVLRGNLCGLGWADAIPDKYKENIEEVKNGS